MINPATHAIAVFSDAPGAFDVGIAAGPDGNIWFADETNNAIGMIDPATHAISKFAVPTPSASPYEIAAGPDGNLWFTELAADKIGMINPTTHAIREFPVPTAGAGPWFITAGPDGHLWFTELSSPKNIGEVDPTTGAITEFPMPVNHGGIGIAAGPDGNLWIGDGDGEIGQINSKTGAVTEFPIPADHPSWAITAGRDGNLWFTENLSAKIGEINPTTHAVNEYAIPYANSSPAFITTGPDGNLWFTDLGNNSIGLVTLNTVHLAITQQPPPSTAAGSSFGLAVEAENSSGSVISSFNGMVTVALENDPGGRYSRRYADRDRLQWRGHILWLDAHQGCIRLHAVDLEQRRGWRDDQSYHHHPGTSVPTRDLPAAVQRDCGQRLRSPGHDRRSLRQRGGER
jgi:virginiamycin B lyase